MLPVYKRNSSFFLSMSASGQQKDIPILREDDRPYDLLTYTVSNILLITFKHIFITVGYEILSEFLQLNTFCTLAH